MAIPASIACVERICYGVACGLAEHDQQPWAQAMHDLLLRMVQTAEQ